MRSEETKLWKMYLDMSQQLGRCYSTDRPVHSRDGGDQNTYGDNHWVWENEVVGFSFVKRFAERSDGVGIFSFFRSLVEANCFSVF